MKPFKIISIILLITFFLGTVIMRAVKVSRDESTSYSFTKEGAKMQGFLAAEYFPESNEMRIQDSIIFRPGNIWIHDAIKLKHRFFIFNEYFEKSSSGGKNIFYDSNGDKNKNRLILSTDKSDSIFKNMTTNSDFDSEFEMYILDDELINNRNAKHNVDEFKNLDTLKFYIKRTKIKPLDENIRLKGSMAYEIVTDKDPIDSILYYKSK